MLALTQSEANEGMKKRDPYVTIGIHVMRVEKNRVHRVHQAMTPAATSDYASARSTFLHLRDVPVGRYIVLPTTFAPREQSAFMLRIYSNHNVHPRALLEHAPSLGFLGCRQATSVTRITVVGVFLDLKEEVKAYCILGSGKEKARTFSAEGRGEISWEEQFVFHRSSHAKYFVIELWSDLTSPGCLMMSRTRFAAPVDNDIRELLLKLCDSFGKTLGYLKVIVAAFDDPMYL